MHKIIHSKNGSLLLGLFVFGVITIFACQLPAKILETVSQQINSPEIIPDNTPSPELYPQPPSESFYPYLETSPTLISSSSTYPQSSTSLPGATLSSGSTYPDPGKPQIPPVEILITLSPTGINTPYPGPQVSASPVLVLEDTQQASPTPVMSFTSTPTPPTISTQIGAYPLPDTVIPTVTSIDAYPALSISPTESLSMPTSTSMAADLPTTLPTSTPVVVHHSTPTATQVYYVTATPSLTPLPTITPTPVPLPPWISSQLHATDPSTVELNAGKVQLIEFFAFWSGPSKAMAPLLHSLEEQYGGQINFIYLDIDDPANEMLKEALGYKKEPHFFLIDEGGTISKQWSGYVTMQEFIETFIRLLPEGTPTAVG